MQFLKDWKWDFLNSFFHFPKTKTKKRELQCIHEFNFHWSVTLAWKFADHVMLVSAANMPDRDPAEYMVFISRGQGEWRIERKIRKSQINTERLTVMFSVSSEIIVLRSFLAFGQAHAILLCFLQTLFGCLSSYKYIFLLQLEKSSIHLVD